MPPRRVAYVYDERTNRYREKRSGRFVRRDAIRRGVDRSIGRSTDRVTALAEQLRTRSITLGEWEVQMRAELRALHTAAALSAKGGRQHMSPAAWGALGRELRTEYEYLRNFADEVSSGAQPLDGRFRARARLYASAAWGTHAETGRREMERLGFDLEENVLTAGESCAGCIAETARGKVPIGTLKKIGSRTCRANDRCHLRFTNSQTGEIAA